MISLDWRLQSALVSTRCFVAAFSAALCSFSVCSLPWCMHASSAGGVGAEENLTHARCLHLCSPTVHSLANKPQPLAMLRLKRVVMRRVANAMQPKGVKLANAARPPLLVSALHTRAPSAHLSTVRRAPLTQHVAAASTLVNNGPTLSDRLSHWAMIRARWSALFSTRAPDDDEKPIPLTAHPDDPIPLAEHPASDANPTAAADKEAAAPAEKQSAPSSSPHAESASPHSTPPELKSPTPTAEEIAKLAAAEEAKARAHEEAEKATFAPIPTTQPDAELKSLHKDAAAQAEDPSASIPKLPSSDTLIRGTLWSVPLHSAR